MANQSENTPTATDVGKNFINQYRQIFRGDSKVLHKFYQDSSVLSRPEQDGSMKSVTTMEGIENMLLSSDYQKYRDLEILTTDSQFSLNGGVIVLVTGYLTGDDKVRRKFTQTFFLAPQQHGYFVLNDIFKYLDVVPDNVVESTPEAPVPSNHVVTEPSAVADQPVVGQTTILEVKITNEKEATNVMETVPEPIAKYSVSADNPIESRQSVTLKATEHAAPKAQKDAPKKSFAAVVSALSENKAPFVVRTPVRKPAPKPVEQPRAPVTPEALPPRNNRAVDKNNVPAVKSHAIFVAKLPMDATHEELEKIFKPYGPIKRNGIQVRSHWDQGNCFGFVEFESADSMQLALQASPIKYGNYELQIEERRGNDKGRFSSGRGGYQNDNFRGRGNYNGGRGNYNGGRGNYNGGRGYGRDDQEKRGEYREFPGPAAGRNGEAYQHQRPYQNGGKAPRQTSKSAA
ncbi:nuclear transport factor 2-like [Pyrus communis]|uniref:nuclear transport factor 2-like n=1 Tax=Pyrus communis TaxID=23211 RepID=UPI0035C0D2B0